MRTSWWTFPPSLKLIWPSVALVSVIAAETLRDLVTLTFDLLTLVSGHTWLVMWSTPPPSLKILRLYVLELWGLTAPIGYHWQRVCTHCACAVSRDLCVGANFSHILQNPWPRFAYAYCNFYGATMKTNGVISQNSVWPCGCAKDHTTFWACAKSRQRSTLPKIVYHRRSRRQRFPVDRFKFWQSDGIQGNFRHIFTAHAQKRLFMNFRLKFWHHNSIPLPRFPYGARYFRDLRTFSVDFCIG